MADVNHASDLHESSIGELLRRLSQETTLLVRQEVDLAKAEMAEKGRKAGAGAGMFGGAGLIGLGAFLSLTACFIIALSGVMAAWLAALIVAVVYGIATAILAMSGKKKFQEAGPPVPQQAAESVKEDVQWVKTQVKSGRT
ncbi:MAG: phage holin family protein [Candidatus Eremiobacteraeota bacterium]|nr:phage holin family protein [Candidatus Eremiobacteraeota bacterium]MBC5826399.1 phage holin family protein [Candidatus Eremiobacteraeota bacterium]